MTTAQRIAARQRLEDAREHVIDARDGTPYGGTILPGSSLHNMLCRIITDGVST